jgi:uncharacterized protein YdeI (YjbR/CyaY-like superfamily)
MGNHDSRIDAYIAKSGDFAKPILEHVRKLVHAACPEVEETIKWNAPFYLRQGIVATTPAFKRHCALIFWKGRLFLTNDQKTALRRLTSIADLPAKKVLSNYIKQAIKLNTDGVKAPARSETKPKKAVVVPPYFATALKRNKPALAVFEKMSPSHKREYVEWISEAKREETRIARMEKAIKQLVERKSLHWKYR